MENKDDSQELSDWEHIEPPFSSLQAELYTENNAEIVKDDFFSEYPVFPPRNHEDLPVSTFEHDPQHLEEPTPPPPADSDFSDSNDGGKNASKAVARPWKMLHISFLNCGIFRVACEVRKHEVYKAGVWLFSYATAAAAGAALAFLLRVRAEKWWRRVHMESVMLLVKQQDQRINELLLQVAQMNELLLSRRRVPVLRVN